MTDTIPTTTLDLPFHILLAAWLLRRCKRVPAVINVPSTLDAARALISATWKDCEPNDNMWLTQKAKNLPWFTDFLWRCVARYCTKVIELINRAEAIGLVALGFVERNDSDKIKE
jgi:hypothetical protein